MRINVYVLALGVISFLSNNPSSAIADDRGAKQIKVNPAELAENLLGPTFAKMGKGGKLMVEVLAYVPVTETRIVKDGDGDRLVTETRMVPEICIRFVGLDQVKVLDANWVELNNEKITDAFRERRKVYRVPSEMRPMLSELKELGKDALFIYLKPLPGDPKLPAR